MDTELGDTTEVVTDVRKPVRKDRPVRKPVRQGRESGGPDRPRHRSPRDPGSERIILSAW